MNGAPLERRLLIAGASGLVGAHAVQVALARGWRVGALARRPLNVAAHENLLEIAADFDQLDRAQDACLAFAPTAALCALGTTIRKAGSQAAFTRVDRDYVAGFAQLAKAVGADRFALVSTVGADARQTNFYLSVKRQAEDAVRAVGFASLAIARPSLIDGARAERRVGEMSVLPIGRALSPFLTGALRKYRVIHAETIARGLLNALETNAPGERTLEFDALSSAARV